MVDKTQLWISRTTSSSVSGVVKENPIQRLISVLEHWERYLWPKYNCIWNYIILNHIIFIEGLSSDSEMYSLTICDEDHWPHPLFFNSSSSVVPPWFLFCCQQMNPLRVRAVFHKTVRVCHVYCNFKLGFTCRITVIFGTLKDGSLLSDTLASNICFSYRNMFQNGVNALSKKKKKKKNALSKKLLSSLSENGQILLACGTNIY